MNKKIIPVRIEYSTSLEKWRGIREFAKSNEFNTSKIDAMIAKIEKVGDASIEESCTFEINNIKDFFYSIFNSDEHPCPHCYRYMCNECPLDDGEEWYEVKDQLMHYV